MTSDLERIAQGLIEYLDANPRVAADFSGAAAECQELASQVAELAVLLPEAAGVAQHLQDAANACAEAAHLAAGAAAVGRAWAVDAVGGGAVGRQHIPTAAARDANAGNTPTRAGEAGQDLPEGPRSPRATITPVEPTSGAADRQDDDGVPGEPPSILGGVSREILERLPDRAGAGKTRGIWLDAAGTEHDLVSGVDQYTAEAKRLVISGEIDVPRRAVILASHVEVKFAMRMREDNLMDETIVINNLVCDGPYSCDEHLEKFLPVGAKLTVIVPGNEAVVYPKPTTSREEG